MGQSVAERRAVRANPQPSAGLQSTLFKTACGWMALIGRDRTVHHLRLGYADPDDLLADLTALPDCEHVDWFADLREQLQAYAGGQQVSFTNVRCALPPTMTDFQRRVIDFVKRLPYGQVLSYGDVAAAVGYHGAARAVGSVMSGNRIPILIPCHRVVAAGGKLGGYSAPRGIELKQWLLNLEQATATRRPH